jgi:hypothetical protein
VVRLRVPVLAAEWLPKWGCGGAAKRKESRKKFMRRVILESPYAGNVERNLAYARRCIRDCLTRGEAPIASHLLFTQPGILRDDVPEERALGIAAGLAWLPIADAMVVYVDHGVSESMCQAMIAAQRASLKVECRCLEAIELDASA